jgi:CRISPR-associated endonuclease Cas2
MKKIVAFDISDDKVRYKMAKFLMSKGIRLQESVFAISIRPQEYNRFVSQAKEIVADKGILHVFHLCSSCEEKSLAINCSYEYCVIV